MILSSLLLSTITLLSLYLFAHLIHSPAGASGVIVEVLKVVFLDMATAKESDVRIPPHNHEAEESVLGSLLIDKDAIVKVADWLSPEDFYESKHAKIYEAMQYLYGKGDALDVLAS